MAISSLSTTLPMLPVRNSSLSSKPSSPFLSFCCPSNAQKPHQNLKSTFSVSLNSRHFRAFASPELLDSNQTTESAPEALDVPDSIVLEDGGSEFRGSTQIDLGADASAMAPKQKIRIKLKSYYVRFIEDAAKQIMDAARTTNAKTVGPVPLPTKKRIYCVLKSPHVHKDARFHFEIRTHQRLIDIHYPTAQTIDALMQLDLPPAVDVQKYGKGDWRSISRNAVVSRTPTQVASHAQKYYLRLNSVKKEKKRSSIHDITTVQSGQVAQPSEQRLADAVQGPTQQPMGPPKFSQNPALQPMGPPKYSNLPHSQAMGALKFAEGPYLGQFREQGSSGYQQFGFPM